MLPRPEPTSVESAVEWLRKQFRADGNEGFETVFQLELSGPGGGRIHGRIREGSLELGIGEVLQRDLCLRVRASDFYAILSGRENAEMLFMADRVEIDGDLSLALKLRAVFRARA